MGSKKTCVLLVAVPHARQGLCVQGEVGRESMVVGSGDSLCTGDRRVRVAAHEVPWYMCGTSGTYHWYHVRSGIALASWILVLIWHIVTVHVYQMVHVSEQVRTSLSKGLTARPAASQRDPPSLAPIRAATGAKPQPRSHSVRDQSHPRHTPTVRLNCSMAVSVNGRTVTAETRNSRSSG